MSEYVFPPAEQPSLPIAGREARFPVRRIFCVGRNYAAHAREMGHDPDRAPPFFFSKPADALVGDNMVVAYPSQTANLHFEAELVVALGSGGRDISVKDAPGYIWGYALGNDLTRRDLQADAKDKGRPWDMAKGFDNSAVCGPVHPVDKVGLINAGRIALVVNGTIRQDADIKDLIWSIPEVIATLSQAVELRAGDLIYTGTPAGVGALQPGDVCIVEIAGLGRLTTTIGPPD